MVIVKLLAKKLANLLREKKNLQTNIIKPLEGDKL